MLGLLLGAVAVAAIAGYNSEEARSERANRKVTPQTVRQICCSEYRDTRLGQREKVNFFDNYRRVDVSLARLVNGGGGGIGLLIRACYNQNVEILELKRLLPELKEIRDYRNNLAHNHTKWCLIKDPKSNYNSVLSSLENIVYSNKSYIAKKMYKESLNSR